MRRGALLCILLFYFIFEKPYFEVVFGSREAAGPVRSVAGLSVVRLSRPERAGDAGEANGRPG